MKNKVKFSEFLKLTNWLVSNDYNPLTKFVGYKCMFMHVTFKLPEKGILTGVQIDDDYLDAMKNMKDDLIFYYHLGKIWLVKNGEIDFVKPTYDENQRIISSTWCRFPNRPIVYYGRIKTWFIMRSIKKQIRKDLEFIRREEYKRAFHKPGSRI